MTDADLIDNGVLEKPQREVAHPVSGRKRVTETDRDAIRAAGLALLLIALAAFMAGLLS